MQSSTLKSLEDKIIIIVQYPVELKITSKCIVGQRNWPLSTLVDYMKNKYIKDATGVCIPKNKTMINTSKKIGEVYDQFYDPDDSMLYLRILTPNPFG